MKKEKYHYYFIDEFCKFKPDNFKNNYKVFSSLRKLFKSFFVDFANKKSNNEFQAYVIDIVINIDNPDFILSFNKEDYGYQLDEDDVTLTLDIKFLIDNLNIESNIDYRYFRFLIHLEVENEFVYTYETVDELKLNKNEINSSFDLNTKYKYDEKTGKFVEF